MNLRYRRLLYLTFFLIFFIIAPILILYTTGYSYNFKKNRLEKTGILVLGSQPKEARVYLNGRYKNTTPTRITRLLPNKYQVEIRKEGYYPWIKEVEIKSKLTTFYKDIILFRKSLPIIKIEGEINILTISPNGEKIIYSIFKDNIEELRLLNLKNNSDFLIKNFNQKTYNQLTFLEWSTGQNKALIQQVIGDFNKYLIIDIETLKVKELFDITRLNFNKIAWDSKNDTYLYGLRKTVLYQIDLVNNLTQPILSAYILDFQIRGEKIYYITKLTNNYFLNQKILDQKDSEEKKIKLPSPSEYSLQTSPFDLLVLLDKKNNDLFIVKPQVFDSQDIESEIVLQAKAKDILWSKNFQQLLYYTNFELWIYDVSSQQNELITRYGQIINQALWHPKNKYIVYQVGDTIQVIETRSEGIKNDITLAKLEKVDKVVVDAEGKNLYFQGKIGQKQGIYQLILQ